MMKQPTDMQREILLRALQRRGGFICPTPGLVGNAQTLVLKAMSDAGWIAGQVTPRITPEGRELVTTARLIYEGPLTPPRIDDRGYRCNSFWTRVWSDGYITIASDNYSQQCEPTEDEREDVQRGVIARLIELLPDRDLNRDEDA